MNNLILTKNTTTWSSKPPNKQVNVTMTHTKDSVFTALTVASGDSIDIAVEDLCDLIDLLTRVAEDLKLI